MSRATRSMSRPSARSILPTRPTRRRRGPIALLAGLCLVLAACTATNTTAHGGASPTAGTGAFAAGNVGVFVAAPIFTTATATPQAGFPSGVALKALRASDGRAVWTKRLTTGFSGTALAGGTLFGALTPLQYGGPSIPDVPLVALRASDGTPKWQVTPGSVGLPLGVIGGTLFVEQPKAIQASGQIDDVALLALAATDGHTLWSDDLGGLPGGLAQSAIATFGLATNGTLVFLSVTPPGAGKLTLGKVIAVRVSDGGIQWTVPVPQTLDGGLTQIVVGGDTVYVAGIFNPPVSSSPPELPTVVALDASSGATRWTHQFTLRQLAGGPPGIAADDQGVYASLTLGPQGPAGPGASTGPTGELVALSGQTGNEAWHTNVPGPVTSLLRVASTLYAGTAMYGPAVQAAGTIAAFQVSDGKQVWSVPVASPDARVVAVVNGSVFATGSVPGTPGSSAPAGGFVEALSASTGTRQWNVETSGEGGVQVGSV